jgi:hypothetical protein
MTLNQFTIHTASCDGSGCLQTTGPRESAAKAQDVATGARWLTRYLQGRDRHLCPKCAANNRPTWWPKEEPC